ncbi:MAG: type III pantothenate kinase [Pseudomonadales bacterium]|nr:type III pantothenate kinase [Pseudomonadales bacterium]
MILEVDAGNTRIKWRLVKEHNGSRHKEAEGSVFAWKKTPSVFIELGMQFDKLPLRDISRTRVANVRGESFQTAFFTLMTEKWGLKPEFAVVEESCGGVRNSYAKVETMGIDRWLAMLAAYGQAGGACCVLDCGSAITLDMIDDSGNHRGGYIVPGLNMMREALGRKSMALQFVHTRQWQSTALGSSTEAAVNNGILCMVAGLAQTVHQQQQQIGSRPRWFLTGGDSDILSRQLQWGHEQMPDLVMDGLSISLK